MTLFTISQLPIISVDNLHELGVLNTCFKDDVSQRFHCEFCMSDVTLPSQCRGQEKEEEEEKTPSIVVVPPRPTLRTCPGGTDNSERGEDPLPEAPRRQEGGSMIFFSQMDARMTNAWLRAIRG
jgi:hypothetical protein